MAICTGYIYINENGSDSPTAIKFEFESNSDVVTMKDIAQGLFNNSDALDSYIKNKPDGRSFLNVTGKGSFDIRNFEGEGQSVMGNMRLTDIPKDKLSYETVGFLDKLTDIQTNEYNIIGLDKKFNNNTVKKSIGTFRDGTGKKIYMLQITDPRAVKTFVKNRYITHYLKTDPNSIKMVAKEMETLLKELPASAKDKFNSVIEGMESEVDRVSEFVDLVFFDSEFNHEIRKNAASYLRLNNIFNNVVSNNHFNIIDVKDGRNAIKGLFRFQKGNFIKFEKKSDIIDSLIKMDSKISDFDLNTKEGTIDLIKYVNDSDFEINGSKVYLEPLPYTKKYFMARITPIEVDLTETAVNGSVIPLKLDPIEVYHGRQIYFHDNKYYHTPFIINDASSLKARKSFKTIDHARNSIKVNINKEISYSNRSTAELIRNQMAKDGYNIEDNIAVYNNNPISVGDIIPIVDVKAHPNYGNKKVFTSFNKATPNTINEYIKSTDYYNYARSTQDNFLDYDSQIDALTNQIQTTDRFEAFNVRLDYNFREVINKHIETIDALNLTPQEQYDVIKNNYMEVVVKSLKEAAEAPIVNFQVMQVSEGKYFKPDKAKLRTAGTGVSYDATQSMDNPTYISKGNILLSRIEKVYNLKDIVNDLYYKRDRSLTSEAVQMAELLKNDYNIPIEFVTSDEASVLRDVMTTGKSQTTYLVNGKLYMDVTKARSVDLVSDYSALLVTAIRSINKPVYDAMVEVMAKAYPNDFNRILSNKVESTKQKLLLSKVASKLVPSLQEGIISNVNNSEVANEVGNQISNVFRLSKGLKDVNINDIMNMEINDLLASFGTTFKSSDAIIRMSTEQYKLADTTTSSIISELINNGTLQQGIECK